MGFKIKYSLFVVLLSGLVVSSGCGRCESKKALTAPIGVDGVACTGDVNQPPRGLRELTDNQFLFSVLKPSGKGELCTAKVYVVDEPVKVYRVYDSAKDYTRYGRWWSFSRPEGPKEQYRKENVICPSWSPLDIVVVCTLKKGTKIAVGPGQSAVCKTGLYEKSATNQVYVPNDSRADTLYVENCEPGVSWP